MLDKIKNLREKTGAGMVDIKKALEDSLKKSEASLRAIVEDIDMIIFRYNFKGELIFGNKNFYEAFYEKNKYSNIKLLPNGTHCSTVRH